MWWSLRRRVSALRVYMKRRCLLILCQWCFRTVFSHVITIFSSPVTSSTFTLSTEANIIASLWWLHLIATTVASPFVESTLTTAMWHCLDNRAVSSVTTITTKFWRLPIWTLYVNVGSSYWYRQSKCLHSPSDSLRMSLPPRVNAATFSPPPSQRIDDSSATWRVPHLRQRPSPVRGVSTWLDCLIFAAVMDVLPDADGTHHIRQWLFRCFSVDSGWFSCHGRHFRRISYMYIGLVSFKLLDTRWILSALCLVLFYLKLISLT